MISLSQRSQNVTPSSTLAITAKINALIADGVDVVKFGAGAVSYTHLTLPTTPYV